MRQALSRLLCLFGIHDWRRMDGHCCECGEPDDLSSSQRWIIFWTIAFGCYAFLALSIAGIA